MGTFLDNVPILGIISRKVPDMSITRSINMIIKEMRELTGLTQKEFAKKFDIPLGTLRRWEYGESKPAPYIIKLIANQLPVYKEGLKTVTTDNGIRYYYDRVSGTLMDESGIKISTNEKIDDVKDKNLSIYVQELFENYYQIIDKFERNCRLDKEEDIIWS